MAQITSTELGGDGRYIKLALAPEQNIVGPQTIMAYCRQTAVGGGGYGYLFAKDAGGSPIRFDLMGSSGGQVQFASNSTGRAGSPVFESENVSGIVNNNWANIVATWDGSIIAANTSVYVNATQISAQMLDDGIGTVPLDLNTYSILLNRENITRHFNGDVAYVARWNRILSQAEINEAMNNGPLNVPDGLVLCWANQSDLGPYNLQVESRSTYVAGSLPPNLNLGGDTPPVLDHATDGDVTGNTADITGEAVLTEPAPHHQSTGTVTGLTSTVTGTAKRFLLHTTSGDVVDSTDAAVTGEAELINAVYLHETEGVLTGQIGTVAGTARRFRIHATDGIVVALDSEGYSLSTITGQVEQVTPAQSHETGGILTGQRGVVTGAAKLQKHHVTSGVVIDSTDATVMGGATKFAEHDSSGIIVGYDAKVVGSAVNVGSMTLTPADIAAIVAALQAAILPVNVVEVNYGPVDGDGTDNNPWGPV